jgi:two-component system LytT family response regulator
MKDNYTAVIIDDELTGIDNLRHSLSNIERITLVGTAMNGAEGKNMIFHSKPDLIFLDIEMPDMTGLDLLKDPKEVFDWPVKVIFYTAYDKYLLEALRASAFDYLLKPYKEFDFLRAIDRFFESADKEDCSDLSNQAIKQLFKEDSSRFLIATIKGYRSLRANDIGFIEYQKDNKHWFIVLEKQRISLKRNTSSECILKLSPHFKQINQQQIINLNYLASIEGKKCILLPPFDKADDLYISRNYFKSVQDSFYIL